jgi:hypothetical protein
MAVPPETAEYLLLGVVGFLFVGQRAEPAFERPSPFSELEMMLNPLESAKIRISQAAAEWYCTW